ncbi:MAG: type VI secretion system protein TssA [Holosporaceae bacterium]|nr:MAG: type VI secretion system protein TssA [Holosporaceae bacterium]
MDDQVFQNLDQFLAPIPGKNPAGKDMKYEDVYDQIKEASREDLDLPQGVWVQDLKSADWKSVEKLCVTVLTTQSKDLQVTAWMLEAWLSLYHMKGIAAGFNLLSQLSENFWDTAFPLFTLEDPEYRSSPYNWINEKLADRFHKVQVTYPDTQDLKSYSYGAYVDIHKDGGVRITKQEEEKDKERNPQQFKKSIEATKDDFYIALQKEGESALSYIKKLQAFLDSKIPEDGPSLYHAQEKIQEIINFAQNVLGERKGNANNPEINLVSELGNNEKDPSKEAAVAAPTTSTTEVHIDTVMNSRSEAYALIEKAANYLEKLDPHSPSPHLIKRAIKWGNLNLHQLLGEMVKNPASLEELRHLLGIPPESEAPAADTTEGGDGDNTPPPENSETS